MINLIIGVLFTSKPPLKPVKPFKAMFSPRQSRNSWKSGLFFAALFRRKQKNTISEHLIFSCLSFQPQKDSYFATFYHLYIIFRQRCDTHLLSYNKRSSARVGSVCSESFESSSAANPDFNSFATNFLGRFDLSVLRTSNRCSPYFSKIM